MGAALIAFGLSVLVVVLILFGIRVIVKPEWTY